ncbi:MAG: hypothetical protein JEZ03_08950 [Bacteroidales bacterium]|nr:hypothetical protein [Bacteroidales bacterium]
MKSIEKNQLLNLVLSGIMLALGVLTKGLVALFPLSLLFWFFIFNENRNFKRLLFDSALILVSLLLPFILLFIFIPESYASLSTYFEIQIVGSISSVQTVDSRFFIVWSLFNELLPMIILVSIIWLFSKKHKNFNYKTKWFLIFFIAGLSGVLPIMISMKQRSFYILATFPLFSIAFAILIMQKVNYLVSLININSKSFKLFNYFCYSLISLSLVLNISQINKTGRDKDKIKDVYTVIQIVPENSMISIQPELRPDWSLHGYLQRYGNISLDSDTAFLHKYLLVMKNNTNITLSNYKKLPLNLNLYELFENTEKH